MTIKTKQGEISLDTLVESFASSFGRVVEIFGDGFGFVVAYPYCRNKEVAYRVSDVDNGTITIHKE